MSDKDFTYLQDSIYQRLAADSSFFEKFIEKKYQAIFQYYNLKVVLDESFLKEVHVLWVRDRKIATERSNTTIAEPDHFKDAGILSYWLKRITPISTIETMGENKEFQNVMGSLSQQVQESLPHAVWVHHGDQMITETSEATSNPIETGSASDTAKAFHDFVIKYPREFPAFRINFNICRFIEAKKVNGDQVSVNDIEVTPHYMKDVCILLREKHTSPYSLSFIYRSLFANVYQ